LYSAIVIRRYAIAIADILTASARYLRPLRPLLARIRRPGCYVPGAGRLRPSVVFAQSTILSYIRRCAGRARRFAIFIITVSPFATRVRFVRSSLSVILSATSALLLHLCSREHK